MELLARNLLMKWKSALVLLTCAVAFDLLFYQRSLGLNLPLFVLLTFAFLLERNGWKGLSHAARWAMLGALWSATMVFVHHTGLAMFMSILGAVAAAAFANEARLRSLFYAFAQAVANGIALPAAAVEHAGTAMGQGNAVRSTWRVGRLVMLPFLGAIIFFQLYRVGSPKFEAITAGLLNGVGEWLGRLVEFFFTAHVLFFLFGSFICGALLFKCAPRFVLQVEAELSDVLERARKRRAKWLPPRSMAPLERERRMGVVLLILVNSLLLVVNVLDIQWLWFGFEVPVGFSLKQFVHEGTWTLIFSILLSMVILLYLFRRNLNFYSRSAGLRSLAILWVAQNLVLGTSVFLRNYHYIDYHGLAHKRIGVIVFLLLVLIGLITLYVKIRKRKSFFFLARVNAWAAFAVVTGLTSIDLDRAIVRYNLAHANPGEVDIDNYLALGDRVLPLLYADMDLVEQQMAQHRANRVRWVEHLEPADFKAELDRKRELFIERYERQRWQEWNLADRSTASELKEQVLFH